MLATKNRVANKWVFVLVIAGLLAGCTPPGPRALLDGKRLLEQGRYVDAVEKLKLATSLIATNAQAWNYLGLACHHAGQVTNAAQAYQKALALNHDLVEARYNLGCLWLEQNKFDRAKAELTAYTQLRVNSPDGWLKLGAAQLRSGEATEAEKSLSKALRSNPQNPEALNAMGLIQLQRRHPREAAQYFSAALKYQPDCRPALLNLAVIAQQYLNDRPTALQRYHAYLALAPRPADWDTVNTIARTLEQQLAPPPPRSVQTNAAAPIAASSGVARTQPASVTRTNVPAAPEPVAAAARTAPPPSPPHAANVEVVQLPPELAIKTAPDAAPANSAPQTVPAESTPRVTTPAIEADATKPVKRSLFQRLNPVNLFRREAKPSSRPTPLPPTRTPVQIDAAQAVSGGPVGDSTAPSVSTASNRAASATPPSLARYAYLSPPKPGEGNHVEAERAFAQGAQAQRANRLTDAAQAYRQAAQLDSSFFEAQYNLGLVAFQMRNYSQALTAYETALALRPDSTDARYNFALVLKAANYPLDAANELEKILAGNSNETRAHLALGNLYAQQLRQPSRARAHYLRVLELDPRHPQAADIRFWLAANPS